MKTFSKRLLTMLLAVAMVFGLSGMTAFAAEADEGAQDEIMPLAGLNDYKPPALDTDPDGTYQEYDLDYSWYTDPKAELYTITKPEQLAAFSAIVNGTAVSDGYAQNSFENQTVTLGNDIEMNSADDVSSEDGVWGGSALPTLNVSENAYAFTPIGNMKFNADGSSAGGYSFEGTFDGKGYTIENLFVFSGLEEDGYDGLFGTVGLENYAEEGPADNEPVGVLKNFTITGLIWVRGGYYDSEIDFAGGACARLTAGGQIYGVTNYARLYTPYTDNVGGIVGFAGTPHAMGGSSETGGGTDTSKPGYEDNPSGYNTFVERCANYGTISAFHKNGGIVGENAATVRYCYNSGWILCRRNYNKVRFGGIAGTNGNNGTPVEESVIAYCYNTGKISNDGADDLYYAGSGSSSGGGVRGYGGMTGSNYGGKGKNEIYNCYNIGAIPKGYGNYNSIASQLDNDSTYGSGAYVAVRNNYSLWGAEDIIYNSASDYPQETGIYQYYDEEGNLKYYDADAFRKDTYGDTDILTCLGPYFVHDSNNLNPKRGCEGFPILWWQEDLDAAAPTLKNITITNPPDQTTGYRSGDNFNPSGMVIYAEYENGARALLTSDLGTYGGNYYKLTGGYHCEYEYDPDDSGNLDNYLPDSKGRFIEITYTDGGITATAYQPINGATPTVDGVTISSTSEGDGAILTAEIGKVDPEAAEPTYQWYKDGVEIEGATEKELTLSGAASENGTYKCVVIVSLGGADSDPVEDEITVEFGQEAPTIESVTITSADLDEDGTTTYNGETVTLTASAQVTPTDAELSYQWYKENESGQYELLEDETDATLTLSGVVADSGTYQCVVTATNSEGSNSKDGTIEVTIERAQMDLSFEKKNETKTVDAEPFTNELRGVPDDATVQYVSSDPNVAEVDEETGEVKIVGAGEATITVTVTGAANYVDAEAFYTLTVTEEEPEPVAPTVSNVAITSNATDDSKTYDGAGINLTVSAEVTPEDAQVTYAWYKVAEDGSETLLDGERSVFTTGSGVADSGTYKCVVTATNDGIEETGSAEITVTIERAQMDLSFEHTDVTKTVDEGSFTNELRGVPEDATVKYVSSDTDVATVVEETGEVTIVGAGEAKITVTVTGAANYEDAEVFYTLTVTEEEPEPVAPTVSNVAITSNATDNTKVYDGAGVNLTVSAEVTPEGAEVTYQWYYKATESDEYEALDGERSVFTTGSGVADSGTYKCVVTATNDGIEETGSAEITVTIERAQMDLSFEHTDVTKTVDEGSFTNELRGVPEDATVKYVSSDTDVATVVEETGEVTIVGAGEAKIMVTVTGAANYEDAEVFYTLTVTEEEPEPADVDKTGLEAAIDAAQNLTESDYTEDSWNALLAVLDEAVKVDEEEEATQEAVDAAEEALQAAMESLVALPADKELLRQEIAVADALNETDYTDSSWKTFQTVLTAAREVYDNADATQSQVKAAEIDLIDAIAQLDSVGEKTAGADKTDLMNEYVAALDLTESEYTAESWDAFAAARSDALTVLTDPDATQEAVDSAKDALQEAMEGLKPVEQPTSEPKNGLYMIEKGKLWGYYVDDVVDTDYTGFASNENGDWYVVNGYIRFDQNTVAKDLTGKDGDKGVAEKGTWWYVVGNKVQHDFTGLAHYRNENGWWYITDGKVDFTHNGVDKNQNGWYYVVGGKVQFDFTGLAHYKNENGWWYITNGKVNFNHNGVDQNQNGWWYVTGGKVQFGFTGLAHYKNANGWWYISAGKVRFDYSGIASNQNGTWYVKNSKVQFDYTGTVRAGGRTYSVVNGKVR